MATRASGVAERMYHASVLPFGRPVERAKASSGWTWIDNGSLVNNSLSSKVGINAFLSGRRNHSSPMASPDPSLLLQGWRSATPQGLRTTGDDACAMHVGCDDPERAYRHHNQ